MRSKHGAYLLLLRPPHDLNNLFESCRWRAAGAPFSSEVSKVMVLCFLRDSVLDEGIMQSKVNVVIN